MESISLTYLRSYGVRGHEVGQFEYPRGIFGVENSLVVCDTQNNRMQITDTLSSSVFGNETVFYPHSVYYDGDYVYVSDSGNHRIVVFDKDGFFVTSYGIFGDGDGEFYFPSGIAVSGDYIYVADRQNNRIQKLLKSDGTFVSELLGFLLPEGVCVLDDAIYVMDSGNFSIKKFDLDFNFIKEEYDIITGYGTTIHSIGGVLCAVDTIDSIIYFLNSDLKVIKTFFDGLWFPESVAIIGNYFYLSQPHQIKIYQISLDFGLEYIDKIKKLNDELYPTGRAWWKKNTSVFYRIHEALSISESRVQSEIVNTQLSIIADNYSVSDISVDRWEEVYGLNSNGTKPDRIKMIRQRMSYPGNVLARQSGSYIEQQLQIAGFDVYVHYKGAYNPASSVYGGFVYGDTPYGKPADIYTICANNVQEDRDVDFNITLSLKACFYICGSNFGDTVSIPQNRKNDFRELILTLKPAHTIAVLFVNYI